MVSDADDVDDILQQVRHDVAVIQHSDARPMATPRNRCMPGNAAPMMPAHSGGSSGSQAPLPGGGGSGSQAPPLIQSPCGNAAPGAAASSALSARQLSRSLSEATWDRPRTREREGAA